MQVWSLGQENPLDKIKATHSSILAWRKPWTEEPGRVQSIGLHRVRHDWSNLAHMYLESLEQTPGDTGGLNSNNLESLHPEVLESWGSISLFWLNHASCRISVPWPEINSLHWEHRVIYHWTTRELLKFSFGKLFIKSQTSYSLSHAIDSGIRENLGPSIMDTVPMKRNLNKVKRELSYFHFINKQ